MELRVFLSCLYQALSFLNRSFTISRLLVLTQSCHQIVTFKEVPTYDQVQWSRSFVDRLGKLAAMSCVPETSISGLFAASGDFLLIDLLIKQSFAFSNHFSKLLLVEYF